MSADSPPSTPAADPQHTAPPPPLASALPPAPFTSALVDIAIRLRWPLLLLAVIGAIVGYRSSRQLGFDQSIENMFAEDDPLLPPYQQLKRTFGGNEIVLTAYVDDQLMTPEGIERLGRVTAEIERVPGVSAALSLATTPMGDSIIADHKVSRALVDLLEGYVVAKDRRTTAVVCLLDPEGRSSRAETVAQLRQIAGSLPSGVVAGEPVMVVDGFRYLEQDGWLLGLTSTTLLVITILACFRSLRWVLVPLAVVQFTLIMTKAILVWGQWRLSMVSSMLSAIVTVIGVATVIHLIVRFREARSEGLDPKAAFRRTSIMLAWPIIGAILTDVVGFISLRLARVGPIQDFGTMMALGSLVTLVGVVLVVPGLALIGSFDRDPRRTWREDSLEAGLERLINGVLHQPARIGVATLILTGLALWGSVGLEVETDFTKNFRSASPIVRSYDFVEDRLGGAGVWDIVIPAPDRLDWDYLARVRSLEERLEREVRIVDDHGESQPALTKVLSLRGMVDATLGRRQSNFLTERLLKGGLSTLHAQMPEFVDALYGTDPESGRRYFRIMLRARERQPSMSKQHMISEVERISREAFPEAQVTGFFVLLTNLIDSIIADQWVTFGAATAGIGLMMLVAFRSVTLALIGLAPNALTIFLVTGALGWLGLKINMGAAMIAAVSMGLSVDSSLHYITDYRRRRRQGTPVGDTLHRVQQGAGRAMVFSTLALIIGFSALTLSEFVPTIYFGVLVSLTMLGGLAGNLIVLPLLLSLTDRSK